MIKRQWLCTCKWPNSALCREREPRRLIFKILINYFKFISVLQIAFLIVLIVINKVNDLKVPRESWVKYRFIWCCDLLTDSHVIASCCKLNLRRDLHWVAKRIRKQMQIWFRPKWARVNASVRKTWPNVVASRPRLENPFDQGFRRVDPHAAHQLWTLLREGLNLLLFVTVINQRSHSAVLLLFPPWWSQGNYKQIVFLAEGLICFVSIKMQFGNTFQSRI